MPTTTLNVKVLQASVPAGFCIIPTAAFTCLERAGIDLFVKDSGDSKPLLLCGKDVEVSPERLDRLQERGTTQLCVRSGDLDRVGRLLRADLDKLLADERVAAEERLALLQTAVAAEIESCFRLVNLDRFVSTAERIGRQLSQLVCDCPILPGPLFRLLRHDASTFTHVTNVAAFCVLLAKELGMDREDEIEKIAVGALLHDIGKRHIPPEILNKVTTLTAEEREIIEQHPRLGYLDLLESNELSENQRLMAYQHHERIDGRGYPVRILGNEIHPWAKLTAIVDVFEALTGERPYRAPLSLADALDYLRRYSGTQFDEEMVRCFVLMMKP